MSIYQKVKAAGHTGQTDKEVLREYKNWVKTYDQDLIEAGYSGPRLVANSLAEAIDRPKRDEVKILDVGAGSGLVAKELMALGFRHIDALDPSKEMLEKARGSDLYEHYIEAYMTGDPLDIPNDAYDVVTGSGVFGHCHIPTKALPEMIRLVKTDGYIILATRLEITTSNEYQMYKDLEPTMDALEASGKWRRLSREIGHVFYKDKQAIVWKYQVL